MSTDPQFRPLRRFRSLAAAMIGVVMVLAPTACGSNSTGTDSTLVIAQTSDVRSLYASSSTVQSEINVSGQITEKLIALAPDGKSFVPGLAEKWEPVDAETTRFTLRTGVTFSNGEPFDAEAAKFGLGVMRDAASYKPYTSMISDVRVVDPQTIDIVTKNPSPLLLAGLAVGSFQYPPVYFAEQGVDGFAGAPIGTGPYLLDKRTKGVSITMKRNDSYWNGKPAIQSLEFRIIPEPASQISALRNGEVDIVQDVPISARSQVKDASGVELVPSPATRINYMFFNSRADGPLQESKVRQALQYAINVPDIIKGALGGYGQPLKGQLAVDWMSGYDSDRTIAAPDIAKAKALLAEAGYPEGFTVPLEYAATSKEIGQAIATQLANVGIETTQSVMEPGTFVERIVTNKMTGLTFWGFLAQPDADDIYRGFQSDYRFSYYNNPNIDSLVNAERSTLDPDARADVFTQMLGTFDADPAFVPLYQSDEAYGVSSSVTGFVPQADLKINVAGLSK
ncbi:ABC transporter substrate-binding protein [Rhodococcus erythropolis]|nr:ABC transporter substrate-binding protein [Rhodococcus erythropolis]